tara:strand:+ start:459 stop:998 length:540 start_codon:yes stop_codon:yes gene_type:complete
MERIILVDEEKRLNLTPKSGTQFPDGTYVNSWITADTSTYRGKSKYAMQVDGKWYYPSIKDSINNKLNVLLYQSKERAKRQGVPHNLTKEYLRSITPENNMCPILKVPFNYERGKGRKVHPHAMSLDRIVPELGYVEGNVMWISCRANTLKRDATTKEMCLIAWYMVQNDKNFNKGENK